LSAARVDIEGLHLLRQLGREPAPEHRDRVLARVGTCILSMTQTIEHLRSLATEPATATCRPVDLRTVVEAVLSERDRWLTLTDTQVNFDPPSFACPVLADPAGLRLILVNLLRNAAEAVAGQDPSRRMVRVRIGPGARVSVEDGGPGLRPEQMARIFEPFRTTKGAGRGVGLALARASALRMRADLTVESEPGLGTRFTLRLPEVAT
jgi:signal transduction histidine kinase